MPSKNVALVAEDKLTEAVLRKCLSVYLPRHHVARSDVKGGRGNVQRELAVYAALSRVMHVVVGVDLDSDFCAPRLLADWAPSSSPRPGFVLRVAVREVESWVLADRKQFARFIDSPSDDITTTPDELADPKRYLLELARAHAGEALKRELVPRNFNVYPRIGPAYNIRMCEFVRERWRPHVAASRSDSLARAIAAIAALDVS